MNNYNEDSTQKLIDAISKKERFTIRVISKCDDNGEINIYLNPAFKPSRADATFTISLIDFSTTNLIPNVNETNNKFHYNNGSVDKVVTIPTGFYLIKNAGGLPFNNELKRLIKNNGDNDGAIVVDINDSTGLVTITLSENYSVLFDKENTFREALGFDSTVISGNGTHTASRVCNLWPTQNIYINCNRVKGNKKITRGICSNSNVIYNFPCNQIYGAPITYQLNPRLTESDLDLYNQLDRIQIKFTDDFDRPVTFGKSQVNLSLRINQV